MALNVITLTPGTPSSLYQPHLADLIDIDAQHPQLAQYPIIEIEIHSPVTGNIYVHTMTNVESCVRQNSFTQRSATVDLVLHDALDWIHPVNVKTFQPLYRLIVREGYGGILQQTFAGWITDTDYSSFPIEFRISATDILFFAHSYYLINPLDYGGILPEDATRDLLARSGVDSRYINIGFDGSQSFGMPTLPTTDATLGRNGAIFAYESTESALTRLTALYGFNYWCDVSGYIQFQYVRPFPQSSPVAFPVIKTLDNARYNFEVMDGLSANEHYSTTGLPGNMLKVISHKYSGSDMRNLVGIYDGIDPPYYQQASPGIPGWPNPVAPYLTAGGATLLAAKNNIARSAYFEVAILLASDLIIPTEVVLAHPDDPGDASTTTMQNFMAQRVLSDLNRMTEAIEFSTWGNPFVDVGQTVYVKDESSQIDGMFFITAYQARFDSKNGYITQIKATGGPTWNNIAPRSKAPTKARKRADGNYQSFLYHDTSWTSLGDGSIVVSATAA